MLIWQTILSGVVLGALSSFHCVGMCGPIAFALPVHFLPKQQKMMGILLYNLGRVFTYALMGLLFGVAGRSVYLGGFQQWFSIALGIVVLLILIQTSVGKNYVHIRSFDKLQQAVQDFIAARLQQQSIPGLFVLGMANGLLPCGMVYLAITGALAAGTVEGGVSFMAAYGIGTLPAMFLLSYFGMMVSISTRNMIKKAMPYVVACMAVMLILRGMNLGIPYISPMMQNTATTAVSCH